MKICQVLASDTDGGLEKHWADLCNGLTLRNEVVAVAHPRYREMLDPAVCFVPINLSGSRYHPGRLLRLRRVLARASADVIHAQANKAAAMVGWAARGLTAKTVATVHGLKSNTRMYRRFNRVIAVSNGVAARLGRRVEVVYNGILPPPQADTAALAAAVPGHPPVRPLAITVGRLVPEKGVDVLLAAWGMRDADLLVVGDGPVRQALEQQTIALNLDDRVRFLGHRDDVPALLAGADLCVIASRREGFSYVFAESLALGTPVVSTRVPVAEEVLTEDFLCPTDDPEALSALLDTALADPLSLQTRYAEWFDFARTELTVARMVEKTEAVYDSLFTKDAP